MVADIDLPVWTIRPNWANGILERLEWLTDVMASTYGTMQSRALRLSPRRTFEMTFNPFDAARSYFDLWLHRLGSQEFMVPLWHDRGRLSADLGAGGTVISVDTTFREYVVGGLAALIGETPFVFDKVEITAVNAGSLVVNAGGVTQDWGKGVAVYPLRRTRISQESLFSALTNRVGEATLQFELNQNNAIADEGDWTTLYNGVPIITAKPNRRESVDLTYNRNSLVLDNDVGLRLLLDDAGRAFTTQTYLALLRGRAEHWAFRQMIYRLRGQDSPVWLPTFNKDLVLARPRLAADAVLDIENIGYAYTGGAVDGRRHVLIDGSLGTEITGTGGALAATEERLLLAAPLGQNLATGTSASFMDIVRQSQDTVEITHHSDTDGTAECNLSFRSFRDERTTDGPIDYPIGTGIELSSPCHTLTVLQGLSWLLPCGASVSANVCDCEDTVSDSYVIGGDTSVVYDVEIRVRGAVELTNYTDGTVFGGGGRCVTSPNSNHTTDTFNVYSLQVSDPPVTYYLNQGVSGAPITVLDYTITVPMRGGCMLTLFADSTDGREVKNNTNLVVPDDDTDFPIVVEQPYAGQFLQVDGALPL